MNVVSQPLDQTSEDSALLWVSRLASRPDNAALDEAALPLQEREQLQQWLAASEANAQAYADARRLWALTALPAARLAREESEILGHYVSKSPVRKGMRKYALAGIAASAMLLVLTGLIGRPDRWTDNLLADYATAPGQVQVVALQDNSQMTLDGDSAVAITMDDHQRSVKLLRGAAYFQVTHNGQPFVVHTGEGAVRVLGTRFEVRKEASGAQVTVDEGRVAVKADGNAEQQLTDGQRVDYWQGGIGPMVAVNPQQAFGWRDGRLAFRQASLSQALEVVQRYYPGRIVLVDHELGQRLVSGDFSSADPQSILTAFQSVLGFSLQRLPGGMVVIL